MVRGEIILIKVKDKEAKRIPYRPNWNGAMVDVTAFVFGDGLPNCSVNEEELTCSDILNCLTFSDRNNSNITITFNKSFLRRILRSHIHQIIDDKII